MTRYLLSLLSRWSLPSQTSVEKRLAALREADHDLERMMARRVAARLRKGDCAGPSPSSPSTVA